jgi:putative transposase
MIQSVMTQKRLEKSILLDSNNHSVFKLYYHLVLVVKYRREVIDEEISSRLKEIYKHIAESYNITLKEWNHDKDHEKQGERI